MTLRPLVASVVLGLAFTTPATSAQNHTLAPIVLRGDAAPGTTEVFWGFDLPFGLSDDGAAFVADLSFYNGGGDAVYADVGAGLELVALEGTPAPGIPGMNVIGFGLARLNAANLLVYLARAYDGVSGLDVIYRWDGGTPSVVVKTGDAAPVAGVSFESVNGPSVNDSGTVAFWGTTDAPESSLDEGVFLHSGGGVTALAWAEATAPGSGGGHLRSLGWPVLNEAGDVAFASGVGGATAGNGLFKVSGGTLEKLVLQGDVLPGTGGGTADWLDFSHIDMNADGTVAFVASVVNGTVDRGIFTISGGVIAPVALEGDPAPGSGGAVFDFLHRHVTIDDTGKVAYLADLSGGSASQGYFRGGKAVALIGEPLPGTGDGAVGSMSEQPAMAPTGAVGFESAVFQGVGGTGLVRATPAAPAVPGLSVWGGTALALLLAGCGARRLA